MSGHRTPGPTGLGGTSRSAIDRGTLARTPMQAPAEAWHEPTFGRALLDKEFWKGYGQILQEVGIGTKNMLLGEASLYSGWLLSKLPGGTITGTYLMVDGASTYLGGMCDVSKAYHGPSVECVTSDFVGTAYRTAGKTYFGEESYGDLARATVSLSTIIRANTIPVTLEKFKGSALHQWVTVPGYKNSNLALLFADGLSTGEALSNASTTLQEKANKK